jgi:hypothetical protein
VARVGRAGVSPATIIAARPAPRRLALISAAVNLDRALDRQ